jgi:hypothetical protein
MAMISASASGLLVPPHRTHGVTAERLWEGLRVLGDKARQGGGQVVAQRDPLLVVVPQREHAVVGPVLVRQELAESVEVFEAAGGQRFEPIALINGRDGVDDRALGGDIRGAFVDEPFGAPGLRALGHGRAP